MILFAGYSDLETIHRDPDPATRADAVREKIFDDHLARLIDTDEDKLHEMQKQIRSIILKIFSAGKKASL